MKRLVALVAVVLVVGVGAGIWYWLGGAGRELTAELEKRFPPRPAVSQRARALEYTDQHLKRIMTAHFALFTAQEHIQKQLTDTPPKAISEKDVPLFKSLTTDRFAAHFEPAALALSIHFTGTLNAVPVTVEGSVTVGAAPALEGTSIVLFPTAASVAFESVSFKGKENLTQVADLVAQALNTLLDISRRVVSAYQIPVTLGLSERIDLKAELAALPGVTQPAGTVVEVGLSVQDAAVLVTDTHLAIVGSFIRISPDLRRNTMAELAAIAQVLQTAQAGEQGCPTCSVGLDLAKTAKCVAEKLQCEINKALAAHLTPPKSLTPVQAVVLRDLKHLPNADAQRLYAALGGYLEPGLFLDDTPVRQLDDTAFKAQYEAVRNELLKASDPIIAAADVKASKSSLAFSREFFGNALSEILAGASASANYRLAEHVQPFSQTIKTDPAPNLNCRNQRGCDSDFQYKGYEPRGCSSNCTIQKCAFGICIDTIDLACAGRKLDCERLKEQERIGYEASKAAAHADFIAKKFDCERLKTMERAGCEINQTWLNQTQNMELADINGTATMRNLDANGSVSSLTVAKDIASVSLQAHLGGTADVNAAFTFIPKNAGNIACIAKWSGALHAGLNLPAQDFTIQANLDEAASLATNSSLIYKVPSREITLKMSPPPGIALLSQNPQFVIACPVPTALFGAIGAALPSPVGHLVQVKLLLDDSIKIKIPEEPLRLQLFNLDELKKAGFTAALRLTPKAIVLDLSTVS